MNSLRTAARRLDEWTAITLVPHKGNHVPPLKKFAKDDKDPVNPTPFMDGKIRVTLIQMAQSITTQSQVITI